MKTAHVALLIAAFDDIAQYTMIIFNLIETTFKKNLYTVKKRAVIMKLCQNEIRLWICDKSYFLQKIL